MRFYRKFDDNHVINSKSILDECACPGRCGRVRAGEHIVAVGRESTHLGCECLESLSTTLLCRVGRCSEDANGHWLDCDGLDLRQENIYRERAYVVDGLH